MAKTKVLKMRRPRDTGQRTKDDCVNVCKDLTQAVKQGRLRGLGVVMVWEDELVTWNRMWHNSKGGTSFRIITGLEALKAKMLAELVDREYEDE